MAWQETHTSSQLKVLTDPDGNRYNLRCDREPGRSFGMQFTVVFTEPYARMVRKIKTAPGLKLFNVLPNYLSFTEFRKVRQEDIAKDLDVSQAAISKALNELAGLGAIERSGTGSLTEWRLSMEWGWRGSVKTFHAEKARRASKPKPKVRPALEVVGGTEVR